MSTWNLTGKTVLVLGSQGLVGSALMRRLSQLECRAIGASRSDADLTDQQAVRVLIGRVKPDALILAAAKVGGILANRDFPVSFLEDNLRIQLNVMQAAHAFNVERLLFLGSSCIYPKYSAQPISENCLMNGALEPTNEAYAIAKIAGIRQIDAYRSQYGRRWISAMPTNLYGPNDNFDLQTSHVVPALLRKFHEAKIGNLPFVTIWGSGTVRREFMYVDDCADALIHVLTHYDGAGPINIGTGKDISINALAHSIAELTRYSGDLRHDVSKPDGAPSKRLDISLLSQLGWRPEIDLSRGLTQTYDWFVSHAA